jgi:hypothetical protein
MLKNQSRLTVTREFDMSKTTDESTHIKIRANRTIICSVVFLDIVAYSKKPVVEQMNLKERFNGILADCLKEIPVGDRVILDTGDGAAIGFLSDPEDALFVAMAIRDALNEAQASDLPDLHVRLGINLGPVKILKDINNQMNLIGDGINIAQRIMSFAEPGQLLVSRSYYDIISCLSQEYAQLFHYKGARADKHVREHDIYAVENSGPRLSAPVHPAHHAADLPNPPDDDSPAAKPTIAQPIDEILTPIRQESTNRNASNPLLWMTAAAVAILLVIGGLFFILKAPHDTAKQTGSKKVSRAAKTAKQDDTAVRSEENVAKRHEADVKSKKDIEQEEDRQETVSASSARADEIEFSMTGIKTSGNDRTITVRIRNTSGILKNVALYDDYVNWPKSKLTDTTGKSYEVSKVVFTKGGQTITSQASGTQGISIAPRESVIVSLTFKNAGRSIKSLSLHPFVYVGRSWKEHDLLMKISH